MFCTTGNFRSFAVPCSNNIKPAMIRRMLSRRGAHAVAIASKFMVMSPRIKMQRLILDAGCFFDKRSQR